MTACLRSSMWIDAFLQSAMWSGYGRVIVVGFVIRLVKKLSTDNAHSFCNHHTLPNSMNLVCENIEEEKQ